MIPASVGGDGRRHMTTGMGNASRTRGWRHWARKGLLAMALFAAPLTAVEAAERPVMRISTENPAGHVQTRMVGAFAAALQARVGDRLDVVHDHGAALFRDRDVVLALQQGQVEMAVPGTWQLDRFQPAVGVFLLPAFYGLNAPQSYALRDGTAGKAITAMVEQRLDVVVPGRWIDLGSAHIYTKSKPVTRHEDLKGLVIRIAGGEANAARLRALGMMPVVIPWPDLPAALGSGKIDGIMTSHETVVSGRLWEHGLRHAFEDRQYFAQYIPLVGGRFWRRLPDDLRAIIREEWEAQVETARAEAAAAQAAARINLIAKGMRITTPEESTLRAWRRRIQGTPEADMAAFGLAPEIARDILVTLQAAGDADDD